MTPEFNFDEWAKLFQENPEEFERRRQEVIDKVISSVQPVEMQHRLRQLQWTIDAESAASKTPMAALVKMQGRMWDSFLKLNSKLQQAVGNEVTPPAIEREAKVLTLVKRNKE